MTNFSGGNENFARQIVSADENFARKKFCLMRNIAKVRSCRNPTEFRLHVVLALQNPSFGDFILHVAN